MIGGQVAFRGNAASDKCKFRARANVLAALVSSFLTPPGTHLAAHPAGAPRKSKVL